MGCVQEGTKTICQGVYKEDRHWINSEHPFSTKILGVYKQE